MIWLEKLLFVERALPHLLSLRDWQTVDVDYEQPRVERVWRQYGELRIMLHRIHPCKPDAQPLFHPHPWPSAMRILSGEYLMGVGQGWDRWQAYGRAAKIRMGPGTIYEMAQKDGWHDVQPIGGPVYTLMITGKPWENPIRDSFSVPKNKLNPLSDEARENILNHFRQWYM